MDKITYLAELAEGLARWVPERERQDILRYYAEYFEEAGPGREGEVVAELGDPWALSCRLAVEGGFVTQQQADSWTPPKKKRWPWALVGVAAALAVIAIPVTLLSSLVGRVFGFNVASFITRDEVTVVERVDEPRPSSGNVAYIEGDSIGGFWNMEDGLLEAFEGIDVDVSLANVTVTGGEDYTLSIDPGAALGGYSLKWEVKDGMLKIRDDDSSGHVEIHNWDDLKDMFGVNASAIDVVITVPDGVQLDSLKVKTGLGGVFLSDLDVEKKLEAETGMGDVECYEVLVSGEADLESGMGDVTLGLDDVYGGAEYDLKTGMGTVEAQLSGLERDWDYEAKTGMGTVTVDGADQGSKVDRKGRGQYQLEAESGMGDVNLYFTE